MPYLTTQPTAVVTPQPPLRALLTFLRTCIVEEELFSDDDILVLFNRGYREAVERALSLQKVASVTLVEGVAEYSLPADHYKTLLVYADGWPLDRLPGRYALENLSFGYYEYGTTIGLAPLPVGNADAWIMYAASPPELATLDSVPDASFPPEFYWLLWHYVRWRRVFLHGGSQRIGQANWERQQYDNGVLRLRRQARRRDIGRLKRFEHPSFRRRPALARDVDAR